MAQLVESALAAVAREALAARGGEVPEWAWLEATGSTNSDLLAAGPPPEAGRVLLAEQQSAGRGRRGRAWHSRPGGSLCLSLALPWPGAPATAGGASLVAGLAVAETLHSAGAVQVRLKWPNDLCIGPRKLGGLLLEFGGRGAEGYLVAGLGLNLDLPRDLEIDQDWTDLAEFGLRPDRVELAIELALNVRGRLRQLQREGLAPLLPQWRRFDALLGREVCMQAGSEARSGTALGVAADGGLRVLHAEGEHVWYSGEASVRPA